MTTNQDIEQARDFIYRDIEREIALAKSTETAEGKSFLEKAGVSSGGGNFIAALALLSYTEYAGRLKNNDFSDKNSRIRFDEFFADLGTGYEKFLEPHNVYKIFRCGLAHEYYVKKTCTIAMLQGSESATAVSYNDAEERYLFVVEKYFEDFKTAFSALVERLKQASPS